MRVALIIANGSVYLPSQTLSASGVPVTWPRGRHPLLAQVVADLRELAPSLPNVEMVLNTDDYPFVPRQPLSPDRPVVPPLFSHYQTSRHDDILCPSGSFRLSDYDRKMLRGSEHWEAQFPWRKKMNRSFWQGMPYCGLSRFGHCSRFLLSHLSAQNVVCR